MQRLQLLAPELRRIQAKYRNDKQRQQQEMMKFYQENRVNPLASCFPLLFQLPFFICAVLHAADRICAWTSAGQTAKACADATLAQFQSAGSTPGAESFLFIPDLTGRATGGVLIVLIVLYVGSQLVSGLLSTASMDRNQRLIMLALPIVFVAFVINFPAGLMVYWITTNCWTIVQQLIVRKTVGLPNRPKGGLVTAGVQRAPPHWRAADRRRAAATPPRRRDRRPAASPRASATRTPTVRAMAAANRRAERSADRRPRRGERRSGQGGDGDTCEKRSC